MNLINDYFLLYHGMHYELASSHKILKSETALMYETFALILTCNRKNFDTYNNLKSFQQGVYELCKSRLLVLDELYSLQYSVIEYIKEHQSSTDLEKMHLSFDYLKNEDILTGSIHEKLISLFDPHIFRSFEDELLVQEDKDKSYLDQKEEIKHTLQSLSALFEEKAFDEELTAISEYLVKQKFSIGVTGVMNAGKSTLLNALMGKEILGSSVVPETANLSLLKYAKKTYAKVFYWSEKEWEKIEDSAKEFKAIENFVKESKDTFKEEFPNYVQATRRIDEIEVDSLSHYTSAQHKMSNLIKEIELGVELEFLSEGVEIVDTPGLDDVVIQREEITKMYLSRCDLMMHLMNVSQSATQKDIDFIIDALLYQDVGKLLIVLTRADSVSKAELEEVIAYTKQSIKTQLEESNSDAKLDFVLEGLAFIAVSSKMALLHKTGKEKEAFEQGYSLQDSGILALETYLHENLYAQGNQKNELIIHSAKTRLLKLLQRKRANLEFELRLLSKNEGELAKELEVFNLQKQENQKLIRQMREEIEGYKQESLVFVTSLKKFLDAQIYEIRQQLSSRLLDDFAYALEKGAKKAFLQSLDVSVDRALKDALVELVREYRYKFVKHSEQVGAKIEAEYEKYEIRMRQTEEEVSAKEMVGRHFKGGVVHSSSAYLSARLTKLFSSFKDANEAALLEELDQALSESFGFLVEEIKDKSEVISQALIEEFFDNIAQPIKMFEDVLEAHEALLSESLVHYEKDETLRSETSMQIHYTLKSLSQIEKRCRL